MYPPKTSIEKKNDIALENPRVLHRFYNCCVLCIHQAPSNKYPTIHPWSYSYIRIVELSCLNLLSALCSSSLQKTMYIQDSFVRVSFLCLISLGLSSRIIKPFYFWKSSRPEEGYTHDSFIRARSLVTKAIAHSVKVERLLYNSKR